jgi:predicted RNase H-like HicB family nuclease
MATRLVLSAKHRAKPRGVAVKFTVAVDRDEDGVWVVQCPSIPGCVSQGTTKAEALKNIEDAIKGCLEVRGMPLTVETYQVEVTT